MAAYSYLVDTVIWRNTQYQEPLQMQGSNESTVVRQKL